MSDECKLLKHLDLHARAIGTKVDSAVLAQESHTTKLEGGYVRNDHDHSLER